MMKKSQSTEVNLNETSYKRAILKLFSCLNYKIVKLIFALILIVVAAVAYGFSFVAATTDLVTAELSSAYDNQYKTVVLTGKVDKRIEKLNGTVSVNIPLQSTQLKILSEYTSVMPIIPSTYGSKALNIGSFAENNLPFAEQYNLYNYFGRNYMASRVIELNPQTGVNDASLVPDSRLTKNCRLPENFEEIAITDFQADIFMRFGYKDVSDNGRNYEIKSPDDLLGKKLDGLTIVGVYSTEEDKNEFKGRYDYANEKTYADYTHSDDVYIVDCDKKFYTLMQGEHPIQYVFVKSGFYKNRNGYDLDKCEVLYKLSGELQRDREIIDALSYKDESDGNIYSATLCTRLSGFTKDTAYLRTGWGIIVPHIIGLLSAVVGAILLLSYFVGILKFHKQEIQKFILNYIFIILLAALLCFVIAVTVVGISCLAMNMYAGINLFALGIVACLIILGICLGLIAASALITFAIVKNINNK